MTRLTTYKSNFASGEIDPTLRGQLELRAYENGAARARDVQRRHTGGLERRWGTFDLIALAADANLIDFEFSSTQRYVFAFSNAKLEIFDLNGVLLQTLTGCPWNATQAFALRTTQLADTMIVTADGMVTQVLLRTGASTFTRTAFAFEASIDGNLTYQPYYKFADPAVTMTSSGSSGSVTLTASATTGWGGFVAGHIGLRFKIYDTELQITAVTSATVATATVKGTLEGALDIDPFKTKKGSATVEVLHLFHGLATGQSITFSGANTVGGIPGASFDATFAVTVVDEHHYTIALAALSYPVREDLNQDGTDETNTYTAAHDSEDGGGPNVKFTVAGAATRNWLEPSISPVRGYPLACAFHEGRLWLAGTDDQPDGVWGSNALTYYRFSVGQGYDSDSPQSATGSEDVSRIQHLVSNGDLQIFTSTREAVFITRDGEPITPNNQRVKVQSEAGSGNVQPVSYDGATLFVQENGLSVSEFVFSSEEGGFVATPISTLAGHLIVNPKTMAASRGTVARAEQLAYVVNSDGTVAVFHSSRRENIAGWVLWTLGAGLVRSLCCAGPYVFLSVSVRGAFRLYRLAETNLACLDGQVAHTGVSSTTWTLDARVRSRTVSIRSELGYHGDFAIPADGALTLSVAVTNVIAGDAFYGLIETLPPVVGLPPGPRAGTKQRLVRSIVQLEDSYGVTINGQLVVTLDAGEDWAAASQPANGYVERRKLGFSRAPTTTIGQLAPLPMRVLSVLEEVKV